MEMRLSAGVVIVPANGAGAPGPATKSETVIALGLA
jgi:hypothetical protein